MKTGKIMLGLLIAVTITVASFSGCVEEEGTKSTITITGSSTVLPIAETAAEEFMAANPDITVTVSGGGSSVGIKAVLSGTHDIGDASRTYKESDFKNEDGTYKYTDDDGNPITEDDIIDNIVAYDGIAVVVSTDVYQHITELTMDQLYRIYTGNISDWQEIGYPESLEIFVNERASTSGTRASFVELVKNDEGTALEDFEDEGGELAVNKVNQENSDVVDAVAGSVGAIGYVGLGYIGEDNPALAIDGVEPTVETVQSEEYPISRSLHMYTRGEPTGLVKDFIDYVQSDEGQEIVEEEGFVPL